MSFRTTLTVCAAGLLVAGPVSSVFATPITTDLTFWVKADAGVTKDGSNYVTAWADQSPDSQPSAGPDGTQPLWVANALNGKPVIRFDGDDRLITGRPDNGDTLTDPIQGDSLTVFVVAERNAVSSNTSKAVFVQNGDTSDWSVNAGPSTFTMAFEGGGSKLQPYRNNNGLSDAGHPGNNVPYIFATVFDGTNNTSYLNGTAATAVGSTGDFDIDDVIIGARWNGSFHKYYEGDIAELIVYEAELSADEQNQVGYYLQQKYGISGAYTPEPATLALLGLGGLGMLVSRKRRR